MSTASRNSRLDNVRNSAADRFVCAPLHDSNLTISQGPSTRRVREPERLYPGPDPPFTNKANLHQFLRRYVTVVWYLLDLIT